MTPNLSDEYFRLMTSDQKEDKKEAYSKVIEVGFQILNPVHEKIIGDLRTAQNQDAMILFQMVMSKGLAIQKLIDGIDYKNPKTKISTNILDPTSIAALTRTQFEAFSNFHNIYLSSKDQNVIDLLHDIWVVAGLNERQRGVEPTIEEHKTKASQEKTKIDGIIQRIKINSVFCKEDANKQSKILDWISKRKFEITYRNNKLVLLSQKDLFLNSGVNEAFENQYSLLSWFVHPSYISVVQFGQMYEQNFNEHHSYTFLRISRIIMSMLIADYTMYFPVAMEEFRSLPKIDQLIIHSDNKTFRPNSEFKSDAIVDLEKELFEILKVFKK